MPQRSHLFTSWFCVTAGVCWELQCDSQLAFMAFLECSGNELEFVKSFHKKSCGPMLLITLRSASRSLLRWFKTCPPFSVNLFFSSSKKKTIYIYILDAWTQWRLRNGCDTSRPCAHCVMPNRDLSFTCWWPQTITVLERNMWKLASMIHRCKCLPWRQTRIP